MKVKTHLIITDVKDEYDINWCGRLLDSNPLIKNSKPIFVVIGNHHRVEFNTVDTRMLEKYGKMFAEAKGREAVTKGCSRIYIKEVDGNEKLTCVVTHWRIKQFAPMYDEIPFRD